MRRVISRRRRSNLRSPSGFGKRRRKWNHRIGENTKGGTDDDPEKLVRTPYSKTSSLLAVEVAVHLGTKAGIRADREAAVSMVTSAALCNPLNLD